MEKDRKERECVRQKIKKERKGKRDGKRKRDTGGHKRL